MHKPIEDHLEALMNALAHVALDAMPEGYGFTMLAFRLNAPDGYMNYISTGQRDDMICALKELVANLEARVINQEGPHHVN